MRGGRTWRFDCITKHGGFYRKHKQIGRLAHLSRTRKTSSGFKGMFSWFYAGISSLLIKIELTLRNRELSTFVNRRFFH